MKTNNNSALPASSHIGNLGQSSLYGGLLWALTLLFLMRVLGQLIQRCLPQPYLPPSDSFQGSGLPYWLLLSAQVAILTSMVWYSWRAHTRRLVPRRSVGSALAWCGGIYMFGALARIVIGITISAAPAWFSTWIPAVFHVVLAGYVLVLASYHRQTTWAKAS
jgi:hypothetical protein